MFTGIITETGTTDKIIRKSSLTKIGIRTNKIWQDANVSDSVAVNGTCLTVVAKEKGVLFFEAVQPTWQKTNLKRLKPGDWVNLEPALKAGDKLGGHFVLGHVDGEVKLNRIVKKTAFWQLEVLLPSAFRKFIIENGSVAVNGVSLTVKMITPRSFTVDIIPFTYDNTNLKYKKSGDWLNVEFDYLLKHR